MPRATRQTKTRTNDSVANPTSSDLTPPPPPPAERYSLPIRRPVTTAMVFLTLVVFGLKSYQDLAINLMPDISYPTLTVRTEFEGAAPEDVEKLLTRPLEETLSTAGGMVEISSVSSPGLSEVVLEFTWDTDMNVAQQDVRDRLDLFMPPQEVTQKPVILRYDPTLDPVMRVAITGGDFSDEADPVARERMMMQELTEVRDICERLVKSDLEGELGIAQVLVKGGREEEIQVLLDSARLKNLGLSPAQVVSALAQQNINLSGGRLREGRTEYLVRTLNEYQTVEEVGDTMIPVPGARPIPLREVATVQLGQKDRETVVHINGREAVELAIFKWGDANTVEVCNRLKDLLGFDRAKGMLERLSDAVDKARQGAGGSDYDMELAKTIQSRLPDYTDMVIVSDQSAFIVAAIDEVKWSAINGGLLALLVLYVFLRKMKSTVIIGVAIPISIVAAFVPMFIQEISLNIMSLGGLALGVGMLVDDSIIVLESIFRCVEEGDDIVDAADRGTREVFSADASSTFTTICVFLPIAFVEGIAGQLFRDLALTVTYSLLASLAVALYLIPMLASRQPLAFLSDKDATWITAAYRRARHAGQRRGGAILLLPVYGIGIAWGWAVQTFRDTAGAAIGTLRRTASACVGSGGAGEAVLAWLTLPLVLIQAALLLGLYVVQLALRAVLTVFATFLFLFTIVVVATCWIVGYVLHLVMWVPLKLFDIGFNAFRDGYTVFLRQALPLGPAVLLIVAGVAVHAGYTAAGLGRELIPPMKQGEFGIRMEAPPGTRLEETTEQARAIEEIVLAMEEVDTVAVEVGQEKIKASGDRGENIAQFTVRLKNPKENAPRQDEIIAALRDEVEAATSNQVTFTLPALFSFKTAVELQVRGDDLRELREVGQRALEAVRDVPGVEDIELTMKEGYPEVIIELDRDLLAEKGLTPQGVAQRLRTEVQGDLATRFNRAGAKIDMRVRTDRDRLASLADLRALSVTDGHPPIPLSTVARITVQDGPSEIRRIDQRQTAVITANVQGRDLGAVSRDIEERLKTVSKPRDYQFILGGQNRELQTSYSSMQFALVLAIFLVYVVMACQFESIHQPGLVMFSLPLAFIGTIYALYFLGISISIVVFIGAIVLAGIVVNDSIILIDYVNQLRQRGLSKREAVVQAARVRLRPILITTLTTVLGLLPMALQTGEGAEMRAPMAITIIAGETSATILTLIVIPMAYDLFGGRDPA